MNGPIAGRPLTIETCTSGSSWRPRWDLKALHAGVNESRARRGVTWAQIAQELRCQPSQLTGLKHARFATGMALAMRITQWVGRSASDFIYPACW
jgi:hypothetical protein